jgi:two-component system, NtrC family, sensor histidine kinase GlrK
MTLQIALALVAAFILGAVIYARVRRGSARDPSPPDDAIRNTLARHESESAARAELLLLEERARGFERVALLEQTADEFAHEIGTPLETLRDQILKLREDLQATDHAPAADRFAPVVAQFDRVSDVVRHGLDRGSWPLPRSDRLDLLEVARRLARVIGPTAQTAGIAVSAEGAALAATGDERFLEQILLNLLKNAIAVLPKRGTIELRVERVGGKAAIDVIDDGPGFAPEAQVRLFEPYVTTKGEHGTGLGLTVARRLAHAQGGELLLLPSARGAHWRLTLPLAATETSD